MKQLVDDFIHWHQTIPHDSLFGDSKVAYDAQTRVLRQLKSFLEGDQNIKDYVDYAKMRYPQNGL